MTAVKVVSKLLRFKGFRAVDLWFEGLGGSDVVIAVKPHKTGCRCPQCGRRGRIVRTMKPRRWRDVRVCGRTVWLQHCPREIRCPTHGRRVEDPPWAEPTARTSYRFELLLRYCQAMSQKAASGLLGLAPSHRLRPPAPDRPASSTPAQDSGTQDPGRRRDLLRPGPPIRHGGL